MKSGRTAQLKMAILAGLCAAALAGCAGGALGQSRSPAYLVIDSLVGTASQSTLVESDVSKIADDYGTLNVTLALKDVGTTASPTAPTSDNAITVTQYHVAYARSDGGSVPAAFDSAVTATVGPSNPSTALNIVLVQAQAKEQLPLSDLVIGAVVQPLPVIDTVATVTLYGHDQTGNAVSVSGQVGVNFADWSAQ